MIFKPNTFRQVWNGCLCEIEMSLKEKMKFAHIPLQPGFSSELLDSEDNSPYFSVLEVQHVLKQLMDLFLATVPSLRCKACRVGIRLTFASQLLLISLHTDLFFQKEERHKG